MSYKIVPVGCKRDAKGLFTLQDLEEVFDFNCTYLIKNLHV